MKREDVEHFLTDFKTKLKIYSVTYRDERSKNLQTLADLEITRAKRTEYLSKLKVEDYCSGPNKDRLNPTLPDYWEFGIKVKKQDVYIKISLGNPNDSVICISFHLAEQKLKYHYKRD